LNVSGGRCDRSHESRELLVVQRACGANPRAQIDAEGAHHANRLTHVRRAWPSREVDRHGRIFDDPGAQRPVVRRAGATEFFRARTRIPDIEKKSVDLTNDPEGFRDRVVVRDMHDLYDGDARHGSSQLGVGAPCKAVADPHRVDPELSFAVR